ncbi:MAG: amidase [Marinicaulis sp.]|nr:amidase [Marinicaulis sp.]
MNRIAFVLAGAWLIAACSQPENNSGDDVALNNNRAASTKNAATHPSATKETEQQDPKSFEAKGWLAKPLPEIEDGLRAGLISSESLVQEYLNRIEAIDRNGPRLQSVIALNPDALAQARAHDELRDRGETLGPLHGIPILLKDNIESADDMATTAGALALKDNVTGRDSPHVAGLREAGAIILGKTNLSQWANFRSNDSMSGWSALGGQVRNPHMLDRNPCGSSSGSGAAVAASLAAGAVGTETNGSIICPSNVNGIVGFKPTVRLVSQQYIVPISFSQDTAGPMTKTVKGAAMMLNAMATGANDVDYVAALYANSLEGARIGVARFAQGSNSDIIERFDAALTALENAGADLIEIEEFDTGVENFRDHAGKALRYEFKAKINEYLASTPDAVMTRTLADLIEFNKIRADVELALFDQSIFEEAEALGGLAEEEYKSAIAAVQSGTRENGIDKLLAENDVVALVSPSGPLASRIDPVNGDVWPDWAGAGWMAAIAGYPHLTVPMGDVHGVPIGISFIGSENDDAVILSLGYAYEQATKQRRDPKYLPSAEARPEVEKAMARPR